MWAADADPAIAGVEGRYTNALSGYLYRVHQQAHLVLGLPQLEAATLQAAYKTPHLPMAKADGYSKAAALFEALMAQPRRVRQVPDMARALTQGWYERGLIDHESRRAVVQANLIGRMRAGALAQVGPWSEYQNSDDHALAYAQERACIYATHLREEARHLLAGAVCNALLRGDSPLKLAGDLTHQFGTLNRDARRLAITEIAFARNNGFLAGLKAGEQVEWFAAQDACTRCHALHGRRFTVSAGPADPEKYVWVGKHAVGKEKSPCIPLHPNCRCRWVKVFAPTSGVSSRLEALLDGIEELGAITL